VQGAQVRALRQVSAPLVASLAAGAVHAAAAVGSVAVLPAGTSFRDCPDCPVMVVVPAGGFAMGSPENEPERTADEGPQHRVTFTRRFAVAKYPTTRAEFARFASDSGYLPRPGCLIVSGGNWIDDPKAGWRDPGFAQSDSDPVVCTNWDDARAYAEWLGRRTGHEYRLLTEAQWEYAARGGTRSAYPWGPEASHERANYGSDQCCAPALGGRDRWVYTSPAGSFAPNAFGLYDMLGNAWEWTADCWHADYSGAPSDGSAWLAGSCGDRVLRGGSWNCTPATVRAAEREVHDPSGRYSVVGFRVARID
jgi:formylglycine-generating enzyme required for sulfatase activity